MTFEYTPYILPLIASAFIAVIIAVYAWMRRSSNGAEMLTFMAVGVFVWTLGYALEIAGTNLETKYFWGVVQYFGIAFVPYGWLLFSIAYSGKEKIITRRFIVLTALIPSVTFLLALATKWNGLIWSEYHIKRMGGFSAIGASYGFWFWVNFAYSYVILLIGAVLIFRALSRRQGLYRGQGSALLVAALAPWLGNAFYIMGHSSIDLTPFAFTISMAAMAWAIFGFQLMDITPLARDHIMDSMREGMIALDKRGNVVDVNNAAARIIGLRVADILGRTADDVFAPWSHLVERFREVMEARDEITVGEGEAQRRYEIRFSPLQDDQYHLVGRVIMLRAMDEGLPPPRFAERSAVTPVDTKPLPRLDADPIADKTAASEIKIPIWSAIAAYFYAPLKEDLVIPPDVSPVWHRTRERIFTVILRIAATVGTAGFLFSAPTMLGVLDVVFMFFVLFILLWVLASARNIGYEIRVTTFLFVIYSFGFIETLNFGFSVESFTFFMTLIVISGVLLSRRGALQTLAISLFTMSVFAVLIGSRAFIPLAKTIADSDIDPFTVQVGISNMLAFTACVGSVLVSVVMLLENLNGAWQKEMQALNLLQQERDSLEQRVKDRTQDLTSARDEAVRISAQLRKYYRAIEQMGSTIVITDTLGNIEYANPRFEQTTGYTVAEAKGENPRLLKSGKQSDEYYAQLWKTIAEGKVWYGEFQNKRKDGSFYWESATIAPVLDVNGAVTNYVAIKDDITVRRQTEEELRKLSQAVEQSGNTVIVMDINGLIEYVNPKFSEVTGYSAIEAMGKSPAMLMNGEDIPDFKQADWWTTINAGKIWHGEFCNHRKDGVEFWESATIAPVHNRDGDLINFVEIKQDITEAKTLQDQLQKQNQRLSILHQITIELLKSRDVTSLLSAIVTQAAELAGASYADVSLSEGDELVLRAAVSSFAFTIGNRKKKTGLGVTRQVWKNMQPLAIENYEEWEGRDPEYANWNLRAVVGIPIVGRDGPLGVLEVARLKSDAGKFTPQEVEIFLQFAALASMVLDNAQLYSQAQIEIAERKRAQTSLQRSHSQQQAINDLLHVNLSEKSLDELLQAILEKILSVSWMELMPKGGIFLFNEQTGMLDLRAHRNLPRVLQNLCSQIVFGQCLCGRAAQQRQIQFANCLDERHEIRYDGIQEHGHYNVPILQGDLVLGVIVLYLPHGYEKNEDDITFLSAVADAVSGVLVRKRFETLLLESEARFRQIVENASDVIYRTDPQGNFTYVNPTSLVVMGYKNESEVVGKSYLELVLPDFRHKIKRFYARQFIAKEESSYYEFPASSASGEVVWFGQSVRLIEEDGKIIGFQAVARDITKLVQAREALAISRDQALDASRFKSQLLSRVSHELRTPLGGILGYSELIKHKAFGGLNERQENAANKIVDSTHYLTRLVNDLLDEAQIESKSLSLHYEYFTPAKLLEKIETTISVLANAKGLIFRAEISPDLPEELYGDINRLQQVVINIAGNAVKFTREGEIGISIKRPEPDKWRIEVCDTGAGIPLEEQKNIFEPFRQVNNAITRENRGTGLGLSITKQLVELMGGEISLESEVGKGSLFAITLPITNEPAKNN